MNSKNVKVIRGQVRQIVQELLQEVLSAELGAKIEKDLRENQKERLDQVLEMVKGTLERIDNRQKDIQSMIVREMMQGPAIPINPAIAPLDAEKKSD